MKLNTLDFQVDSLADEFRDAGSLLAGMIGKAVGAVDDTLREVTAPERIFTFSLSYSLFPLITYKINCLLFLNPVRYVPTNPASSPTKFA